MLNSVKLINALTCIINGDIGGIYFPCNSGYECPYYVDDGDGLWECRRQDCLSDVVTLLKEQEAVKPISGYGYYICGVCRNPLNSASQKFCSECGKKVKWDE